MQRRAVVEGRADVPLGKRLVRAGTIAHEWCTIDGTPQRLRADRYCEELRVEFEGPVEGLLIPRTQRDRGRQAHLEHSPIGENEVLLVGETVCSDAAHRGKTRDPEEA